MLPRSLFCFIFSLVVLTPSYAADGVISTLSFNDFSHKVLSYYPKLKAAHSDVDLALARQMQAKAGFWPSLDLSAGYKITNDPVDVFGTLLRQERFTASDFDLKRLNTPDRQQALSAGFHVDIPLFDSMQTIYRARSARETFKAAESEEAFTKMEALLTAQDAYLDAVTLEKLSAVINEVQKDSDADLQQAKDLKDKGMILGADYYAARVMFGDLTRIKNELLRQKKAMAVLLNILMGEALDKEWALAPSLREGGDVPADFQALLEVAFSHRADLVSYDLRLKAMDLELSRVRTTFLPNVSVFGDVVNDRNTLGSSGGNNYAVGVKASMPLFDPGRVGRVKEVMAQKEALMQNRQLFKDSIRRDLTEETARHEAIRDNLSVLKGMTEDAGQAVSLMVPLYNEGRKSIADLLEVRRTYLESSQAYYKALMGIWESEGRLLFLTGTLYEDDMKKLATEAGL